MHQITTVWVSLFNYQVLGLSLWVSSLLLHCFVRYLHLRVCKDQLTPATSNRLPARRNSHLKAE